MMTDIDRIERALRYIPASDRDTWLRIGVAIKNDVNDETAAFGLWSDWIQRSLPLVWQGIRAGSSGAGVHSLFFAARKNGFPDGAFQEREND
ncbi:MAG: PriCT-2 domain-containing protein [Rhodocyclaceae bacterium]|nr:PriCT-2 domain-containing protein [Rhodocyclaceae bacterium]